MKKLLLSLVLLVFILTNACATLSEQQRREYGALSSAATFSAQKINGLYGENIPDDLNGEKFLAFVKDKIPSSYYDELAQYSLEIRPKKTYYLLLVYKPGTKDVVLFDYSCTPKIDGVVLLTPENYDLNNLDLYDECRGGF